MLTGLAKGTELFFLRKRVYEVILQREGSAQRLPFRERNKIIESAGRESEVVEKKQPKDDTGDMTYNTSIKRIVFPKDVFSSFSRC